MNKICRKYSRNPKSLRRNNSFERVRVFSKNGKLIEEVLPPKKPLNYESNANKIGFEPTMTNRACNVTPESHDFGQLINQEVAQEQYQSLLLEQYGFDPILPDTITQLKELRKVLCDVLPKVENSSQYVNPTGEAYEKLVATSEDFPWQTIESIDVVDKVVCEQQGNSAKLKDKDLLPKNIHISEVPKVKIIAEKFCRFKKNDLEVRKLVERIACIEYDVFNKDLEDSTRPVQKMRAYFSVKKDTGNNELNETIPLTDIPSTIKTKFNINEDELQKQNEKAIEFIDSTIPQNKAYLLDLKTVFKRQRAICKKKHKESLDLESLYYMARSQACPVEPDYSNTNLLSQAELQEVKGMIAMRCDASVHGFSRRTVKRDKQQDISLESTFMELLRDDN